MLEVVHISYIIKSKSPKFDFKEHMLETDVASQKQKPQGNKPPAKERIETSAPRGHYTFRWQPLRKCPHCRQPTVRTEDWACPWCGYPLLSKSYKKIPKSWKQLKELNWTGTLPEEQSNFFTRVIAIVAAAYTLYYLIWRLTTFNPDALWFSWLLWSAEGYGFITFILFAVMTWRLVYPKTPAVQQGISVDVFVPTCGEPIDVLRVTLSLCSKIRYPHQTFVLDDSSRPEVQELAEGLGCNYISRPTHEAAKAGNLNYALKHTNGELIAVLDADHVPLPDFIHNTIGFFNDPSVAVVQGPQLFYNLDSFQHEGFTWHEQRLFYDVIMPGKNRTHSAFWTGSPAVLRRSALEAAGGVAQETVTEDLETTMKLVKHGYYVVYTSRPLASGLAPATIEGYLGQRFRWGQGSMQVLRSRSSPLWARGLTFSQRLNFIASTTTYFDGLQQLILLAIPIVTLLTGVLPIDVLGLPFILRLIPYLLLIFFANRALGRGIYDFKNIWRYNFLRAFTFVSVLPTLLTGRARPFRVTGLETVTNKRSASWRMVTPHLISLGLCLAGIVIGTLHIFEPIWYVQQPLALGIAVMWGLLSAVLLMIAIARLFNVTRRSRYRFPIVMKVNWRPIWGTKWHAGHSTDLSASGIGFEYNGSSRLSIGDSIEVTIPVPDGELPMAEDSINLPRESDIFLVGHIVGKYSDKSNVTQRVGLVIDNFGSEEDANCYIYLLYQPNHMLDGEKTFQLKRERLKRAPSYCTPPLTYSISKSPIR